jgi:hypothetical protein
MDGWLDDHTGWLTAIHTNECPKRVFFLIFSPFLLFYFIFWTVPPKVHDNTFPNVGYLLISRLLPNIYSRYQLATLLILRCKGDAKKVAAVAFLFCFCQIPCLIDNGVLAFNSKDISSIPIITELNQFFGAFNFACNFFIYLAFGNTFRRNFLEPFIKC